jgi:hypothetical protein
VRIGRSGCSRQNQPSDRRLPASSSRPEFSDAICSVVLCTSTDKLHERIYEPYGPHRPANAFAFGARTGVTSTSPSSERNT